MLGISISLFRGNWPSNLDLIFLYFLIFLVIDTVKSLVLLQTF